MVRGRCCQWGPWRVLLPLLAASYLSGRTNGAALSVPSPGVGGGLILHAAPMQGYTNEHLRKLLRGLSGRTVLWTEMEKVGDPVGYSRALDRCFPGGAVARARLDDSLGERGPLVLQLGGSDAGRLAEAATEAVRKDGGAHGLAGINLNCGCPSIESRGAADYGASLMADPAAVRVAAEAVCDAVRTARAQLGLEPLAVSVKCRIGLHERVCAGSFPEEDYVFLSAFVEEISRTGALAGGSLGGVQVHARSAVLSGSSPLRNRSVPPLRPDFVHHLARDFPHLPVTLNGGIRGVEEARTVAAEARARASQAGAWAGVIDGVMLGRSVLARPLDLLLADDPGAGFRYPPGVDATAKATRSAASVLSDYARYAAGEVARSGRSALGSVTVPLVLVSEQLRESFEYLEGGLDEDDPLVSGKGALPLLLSEQDLREVFAAMWQGLEEIDTAAGGGGGGSKKVRKILQGGTDVLREVADGGRVPTKKLSRLLKATIGKKVAGKVERNRSEMLE